jgi:hypothetical protein
LHAADEGVHLLGRGPDKTFRLGQEALEAGQVQTHPHITR